MSILDVFGIPSHGTAAVRAGASSDMSTSVITAHSPLRLIVVGQHMSGKRTFVQGLLQAAGAGRLSKPPTSTTTGGGTTKSTSGLDDAALRRHMGHGAGVSHATILPITTAASRHIQRSLDGGNMHDSDSLGACLPPGDDAAEIYICDHPAALSVALPSLSIVSHSVVLFFVDLAEAESAVEQSKHWANALRDHIASLTVSKAASGEKSAAAAGSNSSISLRLLQEVRRTEWSIMGADGDDKGVQALRAMLLRESSGVAAATDTSVSPPVPPSPFSEPPKVPLEGICPIRSFIVANKLDALERRCKDDLLGARGSSNSLGHNSASKLHPVALVSQGIRKLSILQGSGYVHLSSNTTPLSSFKLMLAYFHWYARATSHTEGEQDESSGTAMTSLVSGQSSMSSVLEPLVQASSPQGSATAITSSNAAPSAVAAFRFLPPGCDHLNLLHPFIRAEHLLPLQSVFHANASSGAEGEAAVASQHETDGQNVHEKLLKEIETRDEEMVWDMVTAS